MKENEIVRHVACVGEAFRPIDSEGGNETARMWVLPKTAARLRVS
jgi:hypothetical protein